MSFCPDVPKKSIYFLLQFGDFINLDMYQKGLYNISVRIFTRDPTHKHPVRIDGIAVESFGKADNLSVDDASGDRLIKRKECAIEHSRCSWKCLQEPKENHFNDMYVSRSFPIIYHGDKVSLNSSVVFHIQVDDVSEPKGGIDAANPAHDYQDAHLEFTLGFSNDVYVSFLLIKVLMMYK